MKRTLLGLLFSLLVITANAQNIVGYPPGASPITASTTGTTGTTTATLPATVGRTTYICGFVLTNAPGAAATGAVANATVSGVVGGPMNFAYEGVTTGQGLLGVAFPQCQPAAGQNIPIVVTLPSVGAAVQITAVTAWGYQL